MKYVHAPNNAPVQYVTVKKFPEDRRCNNSFCPSKLNFVIRLKAAHITDSRIKVMNEVITGIRVIKMYAWEYAFSDVVNKIRRYTCALDLHVPIALIVMSNYFCMHIPGIGRSYTDLKCYSFKCMHIKLKVV